MRMKAKRITSAAVCFILAFCATITIGGLRMPDKVFAIEEENEAYRLIAHFSTYYGDSKQNRKDNIALAARKKQGDELYHEHD